MEKRNRKKKKKIKKGNEDEKKKDESFVTQKADAGLSTCCYYSGL